MRHHRSGFRVLSSTLVIAPLLVVSISANAAAELKGQWIGNSQVDGDSAVAKTSLVLGAADSDNTTLRMEGRGACTLKGGKYAADSSGAWTLSFADASGSDSCERLSKGTFVLRQGNTPRQLMFDVTYPGPDGKQNLRRGSLTRYP